MYRAYTKLATVAVAAIVVGAWGTCAPALAQQVGGAADKSASVMSPDVAEKKVTLNLENADIRYALKLLFSAAGVDYTVDQGVQGLVTVAITDKPFKVALQAVLRGTTSVLPLTYRIENNIYNVLPKGDIEADATPAADVVEEPKTTAGRFRKLFLARRVDASTMAQLLSQVGVSNIGLILAGQASAGGGYGGGFGGGGYGGMGGGYGGMGGGYGGGMMGGMGGGYGGGGFGGGGYGGGGFGGGQFGGGGFGGGQFGGGGFGGGQFGGGGFNRGGFGGGGGIGGGRGGY